MKTAISLPDTLYKEADELATRLGIPRSRLYARALEEFIARQEEETITQQLNAVYDTDSGTGVLHVGLENLRELTRDDTW